MTMIHTGASPSEQSHLGRALTRPAAELLPRVLEALPMGAAVFEVADDEFRFAYGNRGFVRVLSLHRAPTSGQLVGEIFRQAEHDAIMELFRLVQVSREPQSFFAPAGGQGRATNRIWNIDVYPLLSAGRVSHVLLLAEQTEETLEVRQRQQLEADRLRQKAHELAGLEKAKSEFLRLASHELRAPAAMLGGRKPMEGRARFGTLGVTTSGLFRKTTQSSHDYAARDIHVIRVSSSGVSGRCLSVYADRLPP